MAKKYIISIQEHQSYPFDGPKEHFNEVAVRKIINFNNKEEQKAIHDNIQMILSLDSPHIIQITRVLEHRGKEFIIDYQYVPQNLENSQKASQNSFLQSIKDTLTQLCQTFSEIGIKVELKMEDIGVTVKGQPKLFINHSFKTLPESQRKNLSIDYQSQIERFLEQHFNLKCSNKALSELSDYSYQLDKKISEIQDKIHRRKKKSKGKSSPQSGNNSDQFIKPPIQRNIVTQGLSSKNSHTSITSEKTRYSVMIEAQKQVKPKIHKSSFNDFTTTSHKLNESSREDSRKKRIEKALEKTQQAFKNYQKQLKRSGRL